MTPEVLWSFGRIGNVSVSPDGSKAVYDITYFNKEEDRGHSDLYLTNLPEVKVGDTVEIFGQTQSVDALAAILDTIPYELTCAVSKRVPRLYKEHGKENERRLRLL